MPTDEGLSGVSNCYVFKSRLQEYAQKVGLPTPVYETIKEGPSHEPSFRSTVIVKDARYYSLPGFFNRKAAEQSAAEVALVELAKAGEIDESISQPVHETGLCKNLLQEYAQKMNYAIPLYDCQKDETPGRGPIFKCTVEIGGIQYIGASAKTKKEAEIKAARTALLAIQSSASDRPIGDAQLTVIPCRKRGVGTNVPEETAKVPKAKKARFKKKMLKKKLSKDQIDNVQSELTRNLDVIDGQSVSESVHIDGSSIRGASCGPLATGATRKLQDEMSGNDLNEREASDVKGPLTSHIAADLSESGQAMASEFNQSNCGIGAGISSVSDSDITNATVVMEVASMSNNSALARIEASNA